MDKLVTKHGLTVRFGLAYSPWSNDINKRNHGILDNICKKAMDSDPKLTQQQSVDLAGWVHNTNINHLGYSPMNLMIGKVTNVPEFTERIRLTDTNVVINSRADSENKMRSNSGVHQAKC